jgi:hypothetical protein
MTERLTLGFGLRFEDLYRRDGFVSLDACFVEVAAGAIPACTPD